MDTHTKFFTLDEANRTLPLVRRVVEDIVDAYPGFQEQLQQFHQLATTPRAAGVDERMARLRERIERESDRINGFIRELHQIGCLFKGFEEGLVDFYAMHRDEPIFLCWRLGEDRIRYWHTIEGGLAGRRPITEEMEEELRTLSRVQLDSP